MDNEDHNSEFEENDEERKRREMDEFAEKYFSIREEMKRLDEEIKIYEAIRKKFVERFIHELHLLSNDFYPEYGQRFPVIHNDLEFLTETYYDEVSNLCQHHLEGRPGYYSGLYLPEYTITTRFDRFKTRTDLPAYQEIMALSAESFEEEYVAGFYFESYLKNIHLLLKRLLPEFMPEIYELRAEGFRELDGLLYIFQIEIFDQIREAQPA
jgi:hypothetical protein